MSSSILDPDLAQLQTLFASLPGIGPKSASRIVSELLSHRKNTALEMSEALGKAVKHVHHCPRCNTLTMAPLCPICSDTSRDDSVLCLVETPADAQAIEDSVAYRGRYFILLGRLNPLQGTGPTELGMDKLLERLRAHPPKEIVIATSYTAEGETTAHMITATLKKYAPHVRVTRLARGLPVGVEVEYTDAATLASAIIDRR